MRSPTRWLSVLAALCAGAVSMATQKPLFADEPIVVTTTTIPVFTEPPVLVPLDGQVSVVRDYDYPVYYTEQQYWTVRDDGWYHTPRWDQPWATAEIDIVPATVVHLDHGLYVHYRPIPQFHTWSEPNVRYSGPPLFYDPPPLVSVDSDVYVVENFDAPVYYTGGYYWQYRSDHWYRASHWNEPWVSVQVNIIPSTIVHRHHHHYVRYHDDHRDVVFREPRRHEARSDRRHEALVRQARADLNREHERARADRQHRSDHPRATFDRDRRDERRADDRRVDRRTDQARRPDRPSRAQVRPAPDRSSVADQKAAAERRQKARMERDWKRKPTPAAAPAERRRVEPQNNPRSQATPKVAPHESRVERRPTVAPPRAQPAPRPADRARKPVPAPVHKKGAPKGARPHR